MSKKLEGDVIKGIKEIEPTLKKLGYDTSGLFEKLIIEEDQSKAARGGKIIQEIGPENIEFKQNLYKNLEEYADEEAFFNFFTFYTSIYYF
nr:3-hydroxyacyl-CoA dehydrogenase NAD-binding domain-containing protein [Staphylococcus gallinarum]